MTAPHRLDHAGIAARIPHAGRMCLLHALHDWTEEAIHCSAVNAADPTHPLRDDQGLPSACAIEYAAQAMALHAGLRAPAGQTPRPGFLASARGVRLWVPRLDDCALPLSVAAWRLAGDDTQAMYRFELRDADAQLLVDGRVTVVLNQPLSPPARHSA